jgi:hypothetical protein
VRFEQFLDAPAQGGVIAASALEIGGPFGGVRDLHSLNEEGPQRVLFFVHAHRRNLSGDLLTNADRPSKSGQSG